MEIKETAKFRVLSNAIQRSFGKSSEVRYISHYVKGNILDDKRISLQIVMTMTVGHRGIEEDMRKKRMMEGFEVATQWCKKVEKDYAELIKDKEKLLEPKKEPYEKPAPKTVSLKPMQSSMRDSVEYLSYSIYTPDKPSLFKIQMLVEVS
jgi:hypothetical protein